MRSQCLTSSAIGFILALIVFAGLPEDAAGRTSDAPSISTLTVDSFTVLAQNDDGSSSNVRIRGRSIKGLIYLGIAVIGGVVWVVKKIFGGGDE